MKDNSGKVLLALLAGASAGVIAGLLMAPDTGEATRGSVKKWAGKLSKDLEKNLQAGLEEIKTMSNEAYSKVATAAGNATSSGSNSNAGGTSSNAASANTSSATGSTGGTGNTTGGNNA